MQAGAMVELNARPIMPRSVVREDERRDKVRDGDGKDEVANRPLTLRRLAKNHEDWREAVELVDIAAEVDEFFCRQGDGGVEAERCRWG